MPVGLLHELRSAERLSEQVTQSGHEIAGKGIGERISGKGGDIVAEVIADDKPVAGEGGDLRLRNAGAGGKELLGLPDGWCGRHAASFELKGRV
jgi:hypothetical protein